MTVIEENGGIRVSRGAVAVPAQTPSMNPIRDMVSCPIRDMVPC
jgi:hypothetical protein